MQHFALSISLQCFFYLNAFSASRSLLLFLCSPHSLSVHLHEEKTNNICFCATKHQNKHEIWGIIVSKRKPVFGEGQRALGVNMQIRNIQVPLNTTLHVPLN